LPNLVVPYRLALRGESKQERLEGRADSARRTSPKSSTRADQLLHDSRASPKQTCKYLDPASLLALSLSCKTLKGYLQSKASEPVWVVARRVVQLPQLTASGISEWFYAFLVFGQECQVSLIC
jgi:hypothetical protein